MKKKIMFFSFLQKFYLILFLFFLVSCATSQTDNLREDLLDKRLMWPVAGTISSYYGQRDGRLHHGIDIAAPKGSNIYSTARGVVEFSGYQRGYGWTVILNHEDYKSLYAHCSLLKVKFGQRVRQGQTIAEVGSSGKSTGNHLHFELRDKRDKSFDPILYMPL